MTMVTTIKLDDKTDVTQAGLKWSDATKLAVDKMLLEGVARAGKPERDEALLELADLDKRRELARQIEGRISQAQNAAGRLKGARAGKVQGSVPSINSTINPETATAQELIAVENEIETQADAIEQEEAEQDMEDLGEAVQSLLEATGALPEFETVEVTMPRSGFCAPRFASMLGGGSSRSTGGSAAKPSSKKTSGSKTTTRRKR